MHRHHSQHRLFAGCRIECKGWELAAASPVSLEYKPRKQEVSSEVLIRIRQRAVRFTVPVERAKTLCKSLAEGRHPPPRQVVRHENNLAALAKQQEGEHVLGA